MVQRGNPASEGTRIANLAMRAVSQFLRFVPRSLALRRDLREAADLDEADAVIVSYPKSGRTFIRAMLAHLYQRRFGIDDRDLLEFPLLRRAAPAVPRLLFTHAGDAMRRPEQIRIDPSRYANRRLVLIARHPGDIAVSRYHHLKDRSRDRARRRLASQPLEQFIWAPQGGIPSIVTFLNQFAKLPGIAVIPYETFLTNPEAALRRLADAAGLDVDEEDIRAAAEFGKLPNLKRLEREGYFISPRLRRARRNDERSGKVRRGTSGGYRDELDAEQVARIDRYVTEFLDPSLGYSGTDRGPPELQQVGE